MTRLMKYETKYPASSEAVPRKVQRSFVLVPKQLEFLNQEAARLEITVSDLIRRIIDQYREERNSAAGGGMKNAT